MNMDLLCFEAKKQFMCLSLTQSLIPEDQVLSIHPSVWKRMSSINTCFKNEHIQSNVKTEVAIILSFNQ